MPATQSAETLHVRDLGRMAYAEAVDVQRQVSEGVIAGQMPPTLLLVEHDPVITITPRKGVANHLLASRQRLKELGIDVQPTDRGGDITYHGPGQLVAYPILRLAPLGLNLSRYMRLLEQVVIDTVAAFGVEGFREAGATGVWVKWKLETSHSENRIPNSEMSAKLCALGVRIRRNTTLHGLALNIAPDLSHFETIVPCGLTGRTVTSLQALLGEASPSMDDVKATLTGVMRDRLDTLEMEMPS